LGRARRTENVKVIGRWYNLDPVSDVPFELIKVHVSDSPVAGVATDYKANMGDRRKHFANCFALASFHYHGDVTARGRRGAPNQVGASTTHW
jgi:hypothetical protein